MVGCGQEDPDLPKLVGDDFGWSGDSMAKLKIIQNEILIRKQVSFPYVLHKLSSYKLKCVFFISQTAGFVDHRYSRNQPVNVVDFLHRDTYQRKITSKVTAVGWVWLDVLRPKLVRGDFGRSRCVIVTLRIIKNERSIKF